MGRTGWSPTDERRPRRIAFAGARPSGSHDVSILIDVGAGDWPISRLAAARENLDDDHASAAARAGARLHAWLVRCGSLLLLRLNDAGHSTEQLAGAGDVGGTIAVGEEGILAGPGEGFGQDVRQGAGG